jgi:ubiquinone/menaquinone biosynthesis C-methylase UbiE
VPERAKEPRWQRSLRSLARRTRDRIVLGRGLLGNRYLAAKLLPLAPDERYAVLRRSDSSDLAEDGLPPPPQELWQRWGLTLDAYLASGKRDARAMLDTVADAGAVEQELERILDFGCAEGRMLRALQNGPERELWGVDVNAQRIAWAQQHLAPPLRLATTTTAPHLPFGDAYFDLVYAISVFTHISDLADAWFLELLRVLRPGGWSYLTIHDEHSVEVLLNRYDAEGTQPEMIDLLRQFDAKTGMLAGDWVYFAARADPGAEVFYRADDLVRRWSLLADFRLGRQEAIGYQTALVFQKAAAE